MSDHEHTRRTCPVRSALSSPKALQMRALITTERRRRAKAARAARKRNRGR